MAVWPYFGIDFKGGGPIYVPPTLREGVFWRNDRVCDDRITHDASHHLPQARAGQRVPAGVAELVDALDLGSSGASHGGSSPSARTIGVCRGAFLGRPEHPLRYGG